MSIQALIDQITPAKLTELLNVTDDHAVHNVESGRGGPFGASITVYNRATGEFIPISLDANAVLLKGIGSAHGEDQAMSPEAIAKLKNVLREMNIEDAAVILSSSGESCPACHAKEEILNRTLIHEGLLLPDRFIVTYGATYQQTKEIAGFDDEPYHLDMQKPLGLGAIRHVFNAQVPHDIQTIFDLSDRPVAVVARGDKVLGVGYDSRDTEMMMPAEIAAFRDAARNQINEETPWDLGGATLYTSTPVRGPLVQGESYWANVTEIRTVRHHKMYEFQTQEAPGIDNDALYKVVAQRPYNGPGASLHVIHIKNGFDNKAQHVWKMREEAARQAGKNILYNGAVVDAAPATGETGPG